MMKYLAAAFFIFIVAVVVMANTGALPAPLKALYDFPYGDKAGHLILFGIMNLLATWTFIRALPRRRPSLVALSVALILALGVTIEEYSQQFMPRRTFSYADLAFSYMGLLLGGWIGWRMNQ